MSNFPKFFFLRVSDLLLQYYPATRSLCFYNYSTCIGKLTTKFELEPAKCDTGLVHIRCCYNGRYWARNSETSSGIGGVAEQPEEDKTKWSCTLFRLDLESEPDHTRGVRFYHVQREKYVKCVISEGDQISPELSVGLTSPHTDDHHHHLSYSYSNWEELVILPKHVAFKTITRDHDDHDPWLKASSYLFMQFASYDHADPQVGNRVFYHPDGSVSIKNDYLRKYWRATEEGWSWVRVDASDDSSLYTRFWPVKTGNNSIALRCSANNKYCKRFTAYDVESGLSARISTITIEAMMEVKEQVMLREISGVHFQLSDSIIYDQQLLTVVNGHVINGSDEQSQAALKFSYTDTKSSNWKSSVSVSGEVQAFMKVVAMPFIVKGQIEFSTAAFIGSERYQWGEIVESSTEVETTYNLHVACKTEMIVSLMATRGTCDIPFKYTQRDTLVDGRVVVTEKDDGLYSCTNLYDYTYKTKVVDASVRNITTTHTTTRPKLVAN